MKTLSRTLLQIVRDERNVATNDMPIHYADALSALESFGRQCSGLSDCISVAVQPSQDAPALTLPEIAAVVSGHVTTMEMASRDLARQRRRCLEQQATVTRPTEAAGRLGRWKGGVRPEDQHQVQAERALRASAAYDRAVGHARTTQRQFRTGTAPDLLDALQAIDARNTTRTAAICRALVEHVDPSVGRDRVVAVVVTDPGRFVAECQQAEQQSEALVETTAPLAYDLPLSLEDLLDRRRAPVLTLEAIMAAQQGAHPRRTVPVVFSQILHAFRQANGFAADRVFRVSPRRTTRLQEYMDQVRAGRFQWHDDDDDDRSAIVPAYLLKYWLRALDRPVIPVGVYQLCLEVGRGPFRGPDDIAACVGHCLTRLPDVNRRVLAGVISALQETSRQAPTDKVVLAHVFAPCLMRYVAVVVADPLEHLDSADDERSFVELLIDHWSDAPEEYPIDEEQWPV